MNLLNNLFRFNISEMIMVACATLIALTFHELMHGFIAYKLGDPTAKSAGRLTLNPIAHIDPIGLVCMILFRFGWAKPVPVNMRWFRHPRRDMAIVAAAGPVSNLLLGVLCVFVYYLVGLYAPANTFTGAVMQFMAVLATLNVGFAVFNLLPLPPLDGSRILGLLLPPAWYYRVMQYERWIQLAVMVLLYMGVLTRPLSIVRGVVFTGIEGFVRWILL